MVDNNQFRWATTSVNGVMVGVSSNPNLQSTQQLLNGTPGNANNPNPYVSAYGKPSPGIDCTDFSAYIYNLALGIQMHSGTSNQVQFPSVASGLVGGPASAIVLDSSGSQLTPTFFYGPHYGTDTPNTGADLDGLISNFQPGDILYIGNRQGIVHAVVWLGGTDYPCDDKGRAVVPFSTSPGRRPVVLSRGDFSSFDTIEHQPEAYRFVAGIHVDRESLLAQRTASLVVRPAAWVLLGGLLLGVTLYADVYRPAAPGKYPVLVSRTPYSTERAPAAYQELMYFAERGYAVVYQDVRGRHESEEIGRAHV